MNEQLVLSKEAQEEITAAEFDKSVKTLLYYQHKIEDVANVATRFLAEARNKYNYFFNTFEPFLREHAKANLKRDKNGEIVGRNYKTLSAGGGVFFRQKPKRITFNESKLPQIKEFIASYLPDKAGVIVEKTIYEIPDEEILLDVLQEIADTKAKELFTNSEEITVGSVKGLEEIYNEMGIEIEEADPFYYCYVGSTKGWTGKDLKANLTQAIDGSFRFDQEEEIDLLIEDLEN